MKHMPMRKVSALLCLVMSSIWSAESAAPPGVPPDAELERQIRLLGSDDFAERDAAHRAVEKYEDAAERMLVAALKIEDAEIHARVQQLLAKIHWIKLYKEDAAWLAKLGPTLGTLRPGDPLPAAAAVENNAAGNAPTNGNLVWLAQTQEAHGHWDSKKYGAQADADIEQTSLAVLAFLGAGHTEKIGTYKINVRNAQAWLRSCQREDGSFAKPGQPVDGMAHAIAVLAMAEGAGMANKQETRESAQRAVNYSVEKHQAKIADKLSGFVRVPGSSQPDLLTTMFFTMQLKSAKVAGLKVPPETFEGIGNFLKSCEAPDGKGYSFAPGEKPTPKATFYGCLIGFFTGYSKDDLESAVTFAFDGFKPTVGEKYSDALTMYIGTLVIFQAGARNPFNMNIPGGNSLWKLWEEPMREGLVDQQLKTGADSGSWTPSGTWASGGRVLTTALHCLSLEIYYRYVELGGGN